MDFDLFVLRCSKIFYFPKRTLKYGKNVFPKIREIDNGLTFRLPGAIFFKAVFNRKNALAFSDPLADSLNLDE